MSKKNLLLFLGAGFSKDAGCPVQKDFFRHVEQMFPTTLSQEYYKGLTAAQNLALSFKKSGTKPTMEDAFCVLDYVYYLKPDCYKLACNTREGFKNSDESGLNVSEARDNFLKGLREVFYYKQLADKTYYEYDLYHHFFTELLEHYNIAIITLNYDLVCESILHKIPNVHPMIIPVITPNFSEFPVPLIKLHGSIDWRETPADPPNIIPPTWSKRIDRYGKYNWIWNEAEKALFYSDKILFIGCSMPPTDQHIHYLLQYGLANYIDESRKKDIFVVKPHWRCSDKQNYEYLSKEKEYNVESIIPIAKTFKEFVNSDFLTLIR